MLERLRLRARNLAPAPSQPDDHLGRLRQSVANARRLLAFAVESSRNLKQEIIDSLTVAIANLGTLEPSRPPAPAAEKTFWKAYDALTQACAPITAESVAASAEARDKRWGATANYSVFAIGVFLFLVALEGYWFVGNDLRREQRDLDRKFAEKERKYRELSSQVRVLESQMPNLKGFRAPSAAPKLVEVREAQGKASELRVQIDQKLQEADAIAVELDGLRTKRDPLVDLLHGWYVAPKPFLEKYFSRWSPFTPEFARRAQLIKDDIDKKKAAVDKQEQDLHDIEHNLRIFATTTPGGRSAKYEEMLGVADVARTNLARARNDLLRGSDLYVVDLGHRVDLLLQVLERFVIPVLLGMLGSLIYILRSLITQMRESSYTEHFFSLSFVRICLGMMAGLFGTLFVPGATALSEALPQAGSLIKELPPLALPLLFGYAVEVLFAFMDKFVKAFTEPAKA